MLKPWLIAGALAITSALLTVGNMAWDGEYRQVTEDYYQTWIDVSILELPRRPLWSPPPLPALAQFRETYPDVPVTMGPKDTYRRVARYRVTAFEFVIALLVACSVTGVLYLAGTRERKPMRLAQTASVGAGALAALAVSRALPNLFIGDSRFFVTFLIGAGFFLAALTGIAAPVFLGRPHADANAKQFFRAGRPSAWRLSGAIVVGALCVLILSRTPFAKIIWGTFAYEGAVCESCGEPATRSVTYGVSHEGHYCAKCEPPTRRPVSLGVFPMAMAAMTFFSVIGALLVVALVRGRLN